MSEWENLPVTILITEDKVEWVKFEDVIKFLKLVKDDSDSKEEAKIIHKILVTFIKCKNSKV